jgi:DNA helicase-2/ATP-dependent DNA helicase PcrA
MTSVQEGRVRTPLHRFGGLGAFGDLEDELAEVLAPAGGADVGASALDDETRARGPSESGGAPGHGGEASLGGAGSGPGKGRRAHWSDTVPSPDALLEGLNDPQRRSVLHRGGPLLVVAGAGSGKTRALTHRVAHLIATGDALPWEVLAITFTNKAADEMRERLVKLIGPVAQRMWVSTFHAACVRILRSHADRLGYRRSFTVYDDSDSRRLTEHVLKDLNIDAKKLPARSVQAAVSGAKAELVDPDAFRAQARSVFERRIADVYVEYQQRLFAASAMDFDDLLLLTVRLLRSFPEVLESYRNRFKHVLVDEYQDTNRAQNEIVLLLGAQHHNVTVVGDTDQAIYGWRSADIRNILEFEESFPDAVVIPLEQNYRSTKTILDAANAVIANNTTRVPKALWTAREAGVPLCRYRAEDEYDEAAWVTSEITRLYASEGLAYRDVAVFYRTNAQSRILEEELVREGIAYRVVGGTRFYDRREVKDVLAYLRVLANPSDEVSARRIVNVPRRGVGDSSVDRLVVWARAPGHDFAEALEHARDAGVTARAVKGVDSLRGLLDELRAMQESGVGPGGLVEAVLERTGYRAELEAAETLESIARLENIAELKGAAAEYDELDEFLESVALVSDVDELEADSDRVSLMTLHTAKGLEFPAVFLVGMEDGVFPHLHALSDPVRLEEERRLAYVGITRAQRLLYVSHAWSRTLWGSTSYCIPSRFLSELPDELVHDADESAATRPDPLRASSSWGQRRWRRSSRSGGVRITSFDSADSDDLDLEAVFDDADADADAFHDPDPWGDAEATVSWNPGRTEPGSTRVQAARQGSGRESSSRQGGDGHSSSGRQRAGGRRSRLPKMAEERFGQGRRS